MIVTNLNATESWERSRLSTEPETPDVERAPGAEPGSRTEVGKGSQGLKRKRDRRHPNRRWDDPKLENDTEAEVTEDEELDEIEDDQIGRNVDIDA